MVDARHRLIWRSVERSSPFQRTTRVLSTLLPAGRRSTIASQPARMRLNAECRSYELGWGLWAFAGREDFSDILDDKAFR